MKVYVTAENGNKEQSKQRWALALLVLGFVALAIGLILVALALFLQGGQSSFSGIIIIGPFPIVFGVGPGSQWLVLAAISFAVVTLIVWLVFYRKHWGRRV